MGRGSDGGGVGIRSCRGGVAEGAGGRSAVCRVALHAHHEAGLESLGVVGVLVVGHRFLLDVLGRRLHVAIVVHDTVGLESMFAKVYSVARGTVVGPEHWAVVVRLRVPTGDRHCE